MLNVTVSNDNNVPISVKRLSVATCVVALLPICVGSLVTTLQAGMAFADWPTSDGQNMLTYPFWHDLRHSDRLVEHTHRLAGVVIGLVSIALLGVSLRKTGWSRISKGATVILIAVIGQGLLGGARVVQNAQVLAMVHSITAALFFALCCLYCLSLHRSDNSVRPVDSRLSLTGFAVGVIFPVVVLGQYFMGGMFRHLGRLLHEHLAGAIVVTLLGVWVISSTIRSEIPQLRQRSRWLVFALLFQVSLGMGSWVTKLGVPSLGWMAALGTTRQQIICSAHTVGGMFLLMTAASMTVELLTCRRHKQLPAIEEAFGIQPEAGGVA